jgi:hypothetical protein
MSSTSPNEPRFRRQRSYLAGTHACCSRGTGRGPPVIMAATSAIRSTVSAVRASFRALAGMNTTHSRAPKLPAPTCAAGAVRAAEAPVARLDGKRRRLRDEGFRGTQAGRVSRRTVNRPVGELQTRPWGPPRSLGSRRSRRASPSMLKPKTAKLMAMPGNTAIHGAWIM